MNIYTKTVIALLFQSMIILPVVSSAHTMKKRVQKYPVTKGPFYLNQHFGINRIQQTVPSIFASAGSFSLSFANPDEKANYKKPSDCNANVYVETYGTMFPSETTYKNGTLLRSYSNGTITVHDQLETFERPVARSRTDNTVPYLSNAGPLRYVVKACGKTVTKGQFSLDTALPQPEKWDLSPFVNFHAVRAFPKNRSVDFSGFIEMKTRAKGSSPNNSKPVSFKVSGTFPYLYQLATVSRLSVQQMYVKDISSDPGVVDCPDIGAFGDIACANFYATQRLNRKIHERAAQQLYSQCTEPLSMQLGPSISYRYGADTLTRLPIESCFVNFKDMYRLHLPALELFENHLPKSSLSNCSNGGLCDVFWSNPNLIPDTPDRSKQFDPSIEQNHPVKWGGSLKQAGARFHIEPDRDEAYILPGRIGDSLPGQFNLTAKVHGHLGLTDHGRLPKQHTHRYPGSTSRFLRWNIPIGPETQYYPANQPIPGSIRPVDAHDWLNRFGNTFSKKGGARLANYLVSNEQTQIIAADGVARLIVRYVPESNGIHFVSLTGDGSADGRFHGSLRKLTESKYKQELSYEVFEKDSIYFMYQAPADFAFGRGNFTQQVNRSVSLEIERPNGPKTKKLYVMRPPLIFVHGLLSNPTTWDEMIARMKFKMGVNKMRHFKKAIPRANQTSRPDLIDWPLARVDYSSTNEAYFRVNDHKVMATTRNAINWLRDNNNVAIEQADIIGHSMGGILGRRLAGNEVTVAPRNQLKTDPRLIRGLRKHSNNREGYVNKLLTINTPHLGSPLANLAIELRKRSTEWRLRKGRTYLNPKIQVCGKILEAVTNINIILSNSGRNPDGLPNLNMGSYEDLSMKSSTISNLSAVNRKIFFPIAGKLKDWNQMNNQDKAVLSRDSITGFGFININDDTKYCVRSFIKTDSFLFPGDGIVSLKSQINLLTDNSKKKIFKFPNVENVHHTGALKSHYLIDFVINKVHSTEN